MLTRAGPLHRGECWPGFLHGSKLKTTADVLTLLGRLIGHTLTGEVDPKIATSVGYLAGIFLKVLEQVELGERVEAIERIILERKLIHTKGGVR
ncbi:MAG: hypothetical protein HY347_06590 [candidate division NC10 bacterium]|nr:hypothetical protein [candidate division NC10 bacterium]